MAARLVTKPCRSGVRDDLRLAWCPVTAPRRTLTALLAFALLAGCTSGNKRAEPTPSPSSESPTPSASPTPSPTPPPLVSPFTGLPVAKLRRVLAVKIDNAPLARPQRGLDKADIVYEEAVEGRTTRFLAIFSSQDAPDIGPVRSVRESDMPLLREYGRVAFGFSGGNTGVLRIVHSNPIIDVSRDARPEAYTTAGRRRDAYNFITSSARLLAYAAGAVIAHDIGLRFGPLPTTATTSGVTAGVVWSRFAHTRWVWSPTRKVYLRYMDGAPAMLRDGTQMSAPTVVIQYATVKNSHFSDVHGTPSPYTTTTGSGKCVVLRDGKAIAGTWRRAGLGNTRYLDASGNDIRLHTGPVWIMLVPNDLRAVIR